MKKTLFSIFFLFCFLKMAHTESIQVVFNRDCEGQLVSHIVKAKKNIKVAIYSFTRFKVARALINAKNKGVKVELVVDGKQAEGEYGDKIIQLLNNNGIKPQLIFKEHGHMHHKFMIIDESITLTGSYNFSTNAAKLSDESLLIIDNKKIAQKFINEWQRLLK